MHRIMQENLSWRGARHPWLQVHPSAGSILVVATDGMVPTSALIPGTSHAGGAKLKVSAKIVTLNTVEGDSIAVNGVCLTAIDIKTDGFSADVSGETLDKSTLEKQDASTSRSIG